MSSGTLLENAWGHLSVASVYASKADNFRKFAEAFADAAAPEQMIDFVDAISGLARSAEWEAREARRYARLVFEDAPTPDLLAESSIVLGRAAKILVRAEACVLSVKMLAQKEKRVRKRLKRRSKPEPESTSA